MKKFYDKKGLDEDYTKPVIKGPTKSFAEAREELLKSLNLKTPIVLRLDRRHTVNVNRDGNKRGGGRSRATSISSLDQFRDVPSIPRVRTREVTKSLSEDVYSDHNYSNASTVVITETELSSSWLYKNMKAVSNPTDDNEDETRQRTKSRSSLSTDPNLSPVILQDPKMKPVPVPTKPRPETTSSRCCYLGIMMIISICSLGFMSTIGGIIYLEMFSNNSVALNPTAETPLDALNLIADTQSGTNSDALPSDSVQEGYDRKVVVNEQSVPYGDSDRMGRTLHDLQTELDEDNKMSRGFRYDVQEEEKQSPENKMVESNSKTEGKGSARKIVHILDLEKPRPNDLAQYIDNTRTQIRMHDDKSSIYEESSSSSAEYQTLAISKSVAYAAENGSKSIEVDTIVSPEGSADVILSSESKENKLSIENQAILNELLFSEKGGESKEPEVEEKEVAGVLEEQDQEPSNEQVAENGSEEQIAIMDEVEHNGNTQKVENETPLHLQEDSNFENSYESSDETSNGAIEEKAPEAEKGDVDSDKQQPQDSDEDDIGYKTMITAINEHIQEVSMKEVNVNQFSSRSGDLPILENEETDSKTGEEAKFKVRTKRPPWPVAKSHKQKLQDPKTVDIRSSLAEAMKHLQALDTKNNIPRSRKISNKPKTRATRAPSRTRISFEQQEKERERQIYLQNLRLMFYNQMQ